jgi:hypothetical protein
MSEIRLGDRVKRVRNSTCLVDRGLEIKIGEVLTVRYASDIALIDELGRAANIKDFEKVLFQPSSKEDVKGTDEEARK